MNQTVPGKGHQSGHCPNIMGSGSRTPNCFKRPICSDEVPEENKMAFLLIDLRLFLGPTNKVLGLTGPLVLNK